MVPAEVTPITTNNPLLMLVLCCTQISPCTIPWDTDYFLHGAAPCIQHLWSHPEFCRNFWLQCAAHSHSHSTGFFSFLKSHEWGTKCYTPRSPVHSPKKSFYYFCFHLKICAEDSMMNSKSTILKNNRTVNYQPSNKYSYPSRFLSCAPPIHKSEPKMSRWKFNLK